jgi:hypothetical protein
MVKYLSELLSTLSLAGRICLLLWWVSGPVLLNLLAAVVSARPVDRDDLDASHRRLLALLLVPLLIAGIGAGMTLWSTDAHPLAKSWLVLHPGLLIAMHAVASTWLVCRTPRYRWLSASVALFGWMLSLAAGAAIGLALIVDACSGPCF